MKGNYRIHWVSMEWDNSKGYVMCGGKGENLNLERLSAIESWCAEKRKEFEAPKLESLPPSLEDLF